MKNVPTKEEREPRSKSRADETKDTRNRTRNETGLETKNLPLNFDSLK